MGAQNWIWVLYKNIKHSYLKYVSRPTDIILDDREWQWSNVLGKKKLSLLLYDGVHWLGANDVGRDKLTTYKWT